MFSFVSFCVFVTSIGLMYDKLWYDKLECHFYLKFQQSLRCKRVYKDWRYMALKQTSKKGKDWSANELKIWMDKIKHYKTIFFTKTDMHKILRKCLSMQLSYHRMCCLVHAGNRNTWTWFEGKKRKYVVLIGLDKWWILGYYKIDLVYLHEMRKRKNLTYILLKTSLKIYFYISNEDASSYLLFR